MSSQAQMRRKKTQINKIRNETGEITADTFLYFSDIQKMIRIYYEQLNASKYINIYVCVCVCVYN